MRAATGNYKSLLCTKGLYVCVCLYSSGGQLVAHRCVYMQHRAHILSLSSYTIQCVEGVAHLRQSPLICTSLSTSRHFAVASKSECVLCVCVCRIVVSLKLKPVTACLARARNTLVLSATLYNISLLLLLLMARTISRVTGIVLARTKISSLTQFSRTIQTQCIFCVG